MSELHADMGFDEFLVSDFLPKIDAEGILTSFSHRERQKTQWVFIHSNPLLLNDSRREDEKNV